MSEVTMTFGPDGEGDRGPLGSGFDLGDEIGRGGMGVVYRARDRGLDREVAVKLLHERYAPGSAAAARFVEEARITGRLQHPGVPAVYQVGVWADGRPFLAMKLIAGRTLGELLEAEGPSPTRWLGPFERVCETVGFAHSREVIHRDLKPANVMVGAFGEVQVLDWGLAQVLGAAPEPKAAGAVYGTPAFMAPEQARGEAAKVDRRADVFGLGAILCALLTGSPPFPGKDLLTTLGAAAAGDTAGALARLGACGADPELVALCKRCLAADPRDRPAGGEEVAAAVAGLRRAADERARAAERERVAAEVRAAEGRKRRRVVAAGVAALVVALLFGVVGTAVGLAKADRERAEARAAEAEAKRLGEVAAREHERAAARLGKAVEAVEKSVARAGTARWARDPSLAAERRQVLEDAVAFYEGFGEATDPVIRRETAVAYRRIGGAYLLLADYPKAGDYLGRARALCEALAAEFPADPRHAADLAEARLLVASEAASAGRADAATGAYRDAVDAARRAVAAGPGDDDARRTLVSCLTGSGFFALYSDRATGGPLLAEAVREADGLLARPGAPFATRALAAHALAAAAISDFESGRPADGQAKMARASALVAATAPDPAAPAYYRDLFDMTAGLLKMMDAITLAVVRPDRAAAQFRAAAEAFDALLAVYPSAVQYRSYQLMTLSREVQVLTRLGRTAEARQRRAELRAVEDLILKTAPNLTAVRRQAVNRRSVALVERAHDGNVTDLERQADELLAGAPADAEVRYNVACALAVGARHAHPVDRERWAARAVELLTGLLDGHFYRGPTNARHVDADADLDPLRDRPDFRRFRAELWERFPPPRPVAPPPRPKPET